LLTRVDPTGAALVAVVRRKQGEEWVLPGGFLPSTPSDATPPLKTYEQIFRLQLASNPTTAEKEIIERLFATDEAATVQQAAAPEPTAELTAAVDSATALSPSAAMPSWLVYLGVCDTSANTDHAWVETAVAHLSLGSDADAFDFSPGSTMRDARWVKVPPMGLAPENRVAGFWDDCKPLHRQWVRAALIHRVA